MLTCSNLREFAREELVDEHAEGVDVDGGVALVALEELGGHVPARGHSKVIYKAEDKGGCMWGTGWFISLPPLPPSGK